MILLQNISKAYAGRFVLSKVSYHFPHNERIALFGVNGTGKTTLLKILCGLDEPDVGTVIRPKALVLGYLPQDPNPCPQSTVWLECMDGAYQVQNLAKSRDKALLEMSEHYSDELYERYEQLEQQFNLLGGYQLEGLAHELLEGLGFLDKLDQDPKTLSGGWRMRLELARVLINKPNFLVLDEPTNHLDLPSLEWLESYLQDFKGTLLFVSHDQELLTRLPTLFLHLHQGTLKAYKGNFPAFLEQKELQRAQNEASLKNLQRRQEDIQRFVDRFRFKASKAAQAQSRLKMLASLKEMEQALPVELDPSDITIRLNIPSPSGKHVLTLDDVSIGYDKPLIKRLTIKLDRGQKIAISGANGIGKTTLLRTLVGEIPLLGGTLRFGHNVLMGYYCQDQLEHLDESKPALDNLLDVAPHLSEQEARRLLGAFLFTGKDAFKQTSVLSGGEKSRLALCRLLAQNPNFLILDEPTNHLDMASTLILADALANYEGTIIFVSHNRAFIKQVATHSLHITFKPEVKALTEK